MDMDGKSMEDGMDQHFDAFGDHERRIKPGESEWPDWIKGVWNEDSGEYRHLRERFDRGGHIPRSITTESRLRGVRGKVA